ncbi:hypothetical protein [Streptomyces sp. NPDC005784]|uniref:hypothetical protein n=1 Tax=Streptomyces sp. NPDC005784 TaxID=3364731 RepID=UPI00368BE07F
MIPSTAPELCPLDDLTALLGADRAAHGRIVFAGGRALEVTAHRNRTAAALPEQFIAHVRPVKLSGPRDGRSQAHEQLRHVSADLGQRFVAALVSLSLCTAPVSAVVEQARTALSGFPTRTQQLGSWVIGTQVSRGRRRLAVWWRTPDGPVRAVAPYLADALRRAGLATTEPDNSAYVYITLGLSAGSDTATRFRVAPGQERRHWDMYDTATGATVRTYRDAEWARGAAESESRSAAAAQQAAVASWELPGIETGQVDNAQVRELAVALALGGHMPYGLTDVDYSQAAGFLIFVSPGEPAVASVVRIMEPGGAMRPKFRAGEPSVEREEFDQDLAAYARLLRGLGRQTTLTPVSVHTDLPSSLGPGQSPGEAGHH